MLATKGNVSNGCTISNNCLINLTYGTRRIAVDRNASTQSF